MAETKRRREKLAASRPEVAGLLQEPRPEVAKLRRLLEKTGSQRLSSSVADEVTAVIQANQPVGSPEANDEDILAGLAPPIIEEILKIIDDAQLTQREADAVALQEAERVKLKEADALLDEQGEWLKSGQAMDQVRKNDLLLLAAAGGAELTARSEAMQVILSCVVPGCNYTTDPSPKARPPSIQMDFHRDAPGRYHTY